MKLMNFFRAVYMRQNANDTTGEHSTVFLKSIHGSGSYLRGFQDDFRKGFNFALIKDTSGTMTTV